MLQYERYYESREIPQSVKLCHGGDWFSVPLCVIYEKLLKSTAQKINGVLCHRDCFIVPKTYWENSEYDPMFFVDEEKTMTVSCNRLSKVYDPILDLHGLQFGKINNEKRVIKYEKQTASVKFINELLLIFCGYIEYYTFSLYEYLKDRDSDGLSLIQRESVRLEIGKIVSSIETANRLCGKKLSDKLKHIYSFQVAAKMIRNAMDKLGKLSGGRGFLSNSIYEIAYIFRSFEEIYMRDI